jgi:hypothetical protein
MPRPAPWTLNGARVRGPEKKPARQFLRRESPAMAKRRRQYTLQRSVWIRKIENQKCAICKKEFVDGQRKFFDIGITVDVHHMRGRGRYYLDESTWLPTCRHHHAWVTEHHAQAVALGWSHSRLAKL